MPESCPHCNAPIPETGTWYVCPTCIKPLEQSSAPAKPEAPQPAIRPPSRMWPTLMMIVGLGNVIFALFLGGQKQYFEALYLGGGAFVLTIIGFVWLLRLHQARLNYELDRKSADFVPPQRSPMQLVMALVLVVAAIGLIAFMATRPAPEVPRDAQERIRKFGAQPIENPTRPR